MHQQSGPRTSMGLINLALVHAVLRARWLSIAVCIAVGAAIAIGLTQILRKQYTASATVMVDVKSPDPITGVLWQGVVAPSYMNTQIDLATSEPVVRQAARELDMTTQAEVVERFAKGQGTRSLEDVAAAYLADHLRIATPKDSNLFTIKFTSRDPAFAAAAANALVKSFVDTTLQLRREPAARHKAFFEANARTLRAELESAQSRLSNFERSNGLLDTSEKQIDVETARLLDLSTQFVQLQADEARSRIRSTTSTGRDESLQEVVDSKLVADLRLDLSKTRAALAQALTERGDRHPQVLQLRGQVRELEVRIAEEVRRIASSLRMADQVNRGRLESARSNFETQRARVANLKALRDESVALRRNVESAQRAYDDVLNRATQMGLESQIAQANVAVVGLAAVPSEPSSPNLLRLLASGLLLGLMVGLVWAVYRESRDHRIRLDSEIWPLLEQPIVAAMPRFEIGRKPILSGPAAVRARRLVTG